MNTSLVQPASVRDEALAILSRLGAPESAFARGGYAISAREALLRNLNIHGQSRYLFLEKHRRPTPVKSPPLTLKTRCPIANDHGSMPREGAIIFSDLIDKLVVLRIECPKCDLFAEGRARGTVRG